MQLNPIDFRNGFTTIFLYFILIYLISFLLRLRIVRLFQLNEIIEEQPTRVMWLASEYWRPYQVQAKYDRWCWADKYVWSPRPLFCILLTIWKHTETNPCFGDLSMQLLFFVNGFNYFGKGDGIKRLKILILKGKPSLYLWRKRDFYVDLVKREAV